MTISKKILQVEMPGEWPHCIPVMAYSCHLELKIQEGSQAIQNFWQTAMDMGIKQAHLETLEVEQEGDAAIEMGQYELSGAEGQRMDQGKYIVVWKRDGGKLKLHKDIWNTSLSS